MSLEVDASILKLKKPMEVKATQINYRRAAVLMRDVTQLDVDKEALNSDNPTAEDNIKYFNTQIETLDKINQFLKDVLKLNNKQMDILEESNPYEVEMFAMQVVGTLLYVSEGSKATEEDLKSDSNE